MCCALAHAIKRKFIAQTAICNKACRSQGETECEREREREGERRRESEGKRSKGEGARQRKGDRRRRPRKMELRTVKSKTDVKLDESDRWYAERGRQN